MNTENKRKYYILSFLLGFLPFLIAAVTFIAQNDGIFYLCSDFNVQHIPFRLYTRESLIENILNMNMPQYDFKAGSGLDYLVEMSSFQLFSPFTLIFALIPDNAALYAIPFMIALKLGACSFSAYIYISRFCKTPEYAMTGAVLYAYSGYSMANLIFDFTDGMFFFPLLLASLEAAVNEKRRGIFGLTAALYALTNYYMFGMSVVFTIIYFLIRFTDKTFRITAKDFLCLGLESVLGVMAAGLVMIPNVVSILNNPRFEESYQGLRDLLLYESPWRYPRILQAIFMMFDIPGYTNFFPDFKGGYPYGSRWSSLGMYIPMFGISGFTAFMLAKKKSWQTRLVIVCLIFAFVPVLNSLFSMGSALYYARWMFTIVLIMASMTACALENEPKYFRPGLIINCAFVLLTMIFCVIFPMKKLTEWESGAFYNNVQKWIQAAVTLVGLLLVFVLIFKVNRDRFYLRCILAAAVIFTFIFSEVTVLFCMGDESYPEQITNSYLPSGSYPEIEQTTEGSRIAVDDELKNISLLWDVNATYVFNTNVNPNMVRYVNALEMKKDDIINDYISQCLMSAKTLIAYDTSEGRRNMTNLAYHQFDTNSFVFTEQKGDYLYFENLNYIPMGFCYEYCISEEDFLSLDIEMRGRLLFKAMVVNDVTGVSEYLTPIPAEEIYLIDDREVAEECSKRAEKTAYSYTTDNDSYYAEITLDEPELVFFSVAYDEGFTAYVDGEETEIVNANFGFQAVPVPAGTHKIQVKYHSVWRDTGLAVSIVGVSGLVVYTAICCILHRKKKNSGDA